MLPLLLLAACTHDDAPASPAGIPLPPDTYPLQIASVTISADGQPRTRLTDEGNTTKWQEGDQIGVRIGDDPETGIYKMDVDVGGRLVGITPIKPVYWKNTAPATITAWYPVTDEIDFTQQDKGLTYLLKAESVNATYNQSTPIDLTFTHQLAKVRVLLKGEKAQDVEKVYVRSYPKSANNQGELGGLEGTAEYVPMYKTTYDGKDCWEATLRDGRLEADNTFEVANAKGRRMRVMLAQEDMPIAAGQVYTINISVNPVIPENATDITNVTGDINDKGDYVVRNNYDKTINITGGSPTIYLDGATVAVGSGNAINITNNATPTIYVVGEGNNITSSDGAGIYVAQGSTVTITGSSWDNELTVTGGNGTGIGGYISNYYGVSCGDINISNITVLAYGSKDGIGSASPGIGCVGKATCGIISISNATIHAFGASSGNLGILSIGCGASIMEYAESIPDVIAFNSEIHAHRSNAGHICDYIGWSENESIPSYNGASTINPGAGGSIKSSTVYCYTGDTLDKTVVYDDQGNDTEITP